MTVYAVQRFRTDTTKDGDTVLKLYSKRENAQQHCDHLNELYAKDSYCVHRARVEAMEVE